jgi:superoxide dismutase, Fe-Mn family
MKNLLIKYARQPSMASLFNHASMAHNNHFYFSCLTPQNTEKDMPESLRRGLEASFTSLDTLRREFVAIGCSMFGPGFVWLVRVPNENRFSLLTTYIAGSPYAAAHYRRQSHDMNTETSSMTPADVARTNALRNAKPLNSVGAFGPLSERGRVAPGGINLIPVLCANTWQHAYIVDWGLPQKKQFLEAWWDRIDWNAVAENADLKNTAYVP